MERVPEPVKGFDKVYDAAKSKADDVLKEMNTYLKEVRRLFSCARHYEIKYVQSKTSYEIEGPKEYV